MAQGLFTLRQVNQAVKQGAWSNQKTPAVEYLVVAGGGGAGGAGGAGGGLLTGIYPVATGSAITVTVGGGGSGGPNESTTPATNGQNSVFGNITALGGGKGGTWYSSNQNSVALGGTGGSGGGSAGQYTYSSSVAGAQATAGQGNAGGSVIGATGAPYYQAGGGGAGTVGLNAKPDAYAGNGGSGIASAINGTVTTYAGGGGGGRASGATDTNTGKGGVGGGGDAGTTASSSGTNGTANTGGGGGGSNGAATGANGGSGIVILSYPDVYAAPTSTTGSPTVSTSGSGSISFNGSSQYLTSPANSVYNFGTGNFTLEAWVYCTSFSNSPCIFDARPAGNAIPWAFYINSSGQPYFYDGTVRNTTTSVSLNTWTHIAAVRNSGTLNIYINGVSGYSASNTTNITSTGTLQIAGAFGASFLPGYLSNARITNTAVYTANFTPSTTPLTAISGTQILLNTVSGAQFSDSSNNSFTISAFVSPTWNASSPFTVTGYKNRVYTWTSSGSITF